MDAELIITAAEAMYMRRFRGFPFGPQNLSEVDERTYEEYLGMAQAALSVFERSEAAKIENVAPTPVNDPALPADEEFGQAEALETEAEAEPESEPLAPPDPELDDNIPF